MITRLVATDDGGATTLGVQSEDAEGSDQVAFVMGPDEPLVNALESAATRHAGGQVRVAVAWARDEGVWWFLRSLKDRIDSISVIVGMNEAGTTVEALLRLLDAGADVTCVFKHPSQTFHPKIYWYSGGAAGDDTHLLIVGSSNMTRGGLQTNFEASLLQEFDHAAPAIASLDASLSGLVASPYAHPVAGPDDAQSLLERGYLSTERQRVRQRRQQAAAGGGQPVVDRLPSSPPPPVARPGFDPMPIPFEIAPESEGAAPATANQPPADADPVGEPPLADRFYVRTLTDNDVRKLHGDQVGTFEPDLGETARDRFPAFWGWPAQYAEVVHQLPRGEWSARARLVTRIAPHGVDVEIMLWFRPARPGHAAEHRLRPGPIGDVRQVVPPDFDTNSLMVVERGADGSGYDFIVRLLTPGDSDFAGFAAHLVHQNPAHRYGYGP